MPSVFRTAFFGVIAAAATVGAVPQATTSAVVPSPSTSTPAASGKPCNNSPTLCGRQYNNITHMGAHDSAFLRDASTGDSVSGNQFKNATTALDAGVRLLQAQVHDNNGTLHLCHSDCSLLDAGPLADWLQLIAGWMDANTNDSMIDKGTRLVAFATDFDYSASVPYLLPEFDFMFETPYEVTAPTGFNCTLDRPGTAKLNKSPTTALSMNYLSLVNHFQYQQLFAGILAPDVDSINVTNSPNTAAAGNFGRHVQQCSSEWGTRPNFMLVDFWNVENPIGAVDKVNGLSDITGRASVSAQPGTTSGAPVNYRRVGGRLLISLATATVLVAFVSPPIYPTMDYAAIETPAACYADFCLIPVGTGNVSVAEEVADVQRVLEASGLRYTMHSAGTTVEGAWDQVMAVIGKAHTVVHRRGVLRVQSSMRVGSRTDKTQTAADKVKRVNDILAGNDKRVN
ncbi:hypothetical protein LLEC1_04699 [Akanthomyces lecanii]|uniref:Thiamine-binding protein domain-containing protein n=1 Tax=Cordyceps confragosa TaxID=2714763 RepID=A0A179I5Q8_CORDF|nr:hypothetical protein LLEC1_04699 [Akanthomyces lecanii]